MAEVREYDRVRITGKTTDCRENPYCGVDISKLSDADLQAMRVLIHVENLVGTVGSATFPEGEERSIKIWPEFEQPYNESGKIWFYESDTESIELLEREE